MGKFRKMPVVIDAFQLNVETVSLVNVRAWEKENGLPNWKVGSMNGKTGVVIHTLEGAHLAEIGDWVIRDVKGEYYPCKPDIFEKTYEAVTG